MQLFSSSYIRMDRQTSMAKPVSAFLQPVIAKEPEISWDPDIPEIQSWHQYVHQKLWTAYRTVFELLTSTAISTGLSDVRSKEFYCTSHLYLFLKKKKVPLLQNQAATQSVNCILYLEILFEESGSLHVDSHSSKYNSKVILMFIQHRFARQLHKTCLTTDLSCNLKINNCSLV